MFDKKEVGFFGPKELREVMESYGMKPTDYELQDMISAIDPNGDGETVNYNQFLAVFLSNVNKSEAEEELRQAFKVGFY